MALWRWQSSQITPAAHYRWLLPAEVSHHAAGEGRGGTAQCTHVSNMTQYTYILMQYDAMCIRTYAI